MRSLWPGRFLSNAAAAAAAAIVAASVVSLVAVGAGCSGARSSFDGTTYRDGAIAFRVPPAPAGWRRIAVTDATLAYRDDAEDASVLVNARCGDRQADAPLEALRNHLLAGTTERVVSAEETIPFDAREGLHTRVVAKLDGVSMAYDIFVLKKDGCVYDFVRVSPPTPETHDSSSDAGVASASRGTRAFETYVQSFRTLPVPSGGAS